MADRNDKQKLSRRQLLRRGLQAGTGLALGGAAISLASKAAVAKGGSVWQIDPEKCVQCGNCATRCVLEPSAVKAVHAFAICGYCDLCTAYFDPQAEELTTGAENQLCPTGAIVRTYKKDPYYEYTIDEELCIGCGKCVDGCEAFGNGSLFLQVRHDRCVNCNDCAIARACPADAFRRVPADKPYLLKTPR
ncbi:MAG: 4Fe-4S binding protein [Phycisphaerae bacterium]